MARTNFPAGVGSPPHDTSSSPVDPAAESSKQVKRPHPSSGNIQHASPTPPGGIKRPKWADWNGLPPELQIEVAKKLDKTSLDNFSLVDRQSYAVALAVEFVTKLIIKTPVDLALAAHRHAGGRIRKITIRSGSLTDIDLDHLSQFTQLEELDVSECEGLTGAFMQRVPRTVKKLKAAGCYQFIGVGRRDWPRELEELDVSRCWRLTDNFMQYVPRTLKKLKAFGCNQLTDACMEHLPSELEEGDFRKCPKILLAYPGILTGN